MKATPHDRSSATAAALVARQRSVVAKCKARGYDPSLAESLLAAMEGSEGLIRSRVELARTDRASSSGSSAASALEPSFLSSVAHDFKNHLQSLKSEFYSARHSGARSSVVNLSSSHEIEGALSMMNLLTCDLLIASTLQDRELALLVRPHPVAALLKEVSGLMAPIARLSEVHLQLAQVPQALKVRCDRDWLLHAMANLVVEAVQGTRRGGRVSISARPGRDTVRFAVATDAARVVKGAPTSAKSRAISARTRLATTLIEAQGGRVWSGKAVGSGNRTYVTMSSEHG